VGKYHAHIFDRHSVAPEIAGSPHNLLVDT
jgi:hypothetical protein